MTHGTDGESATHGTTAHGITTTITAALGSIPECTTACTSTIHGSRSATLGSTAHGTMIHGTTVHGIMEESAHGTVITTTGDILITMEAGTPTADGVT